jgi:predicted PurR-regulated permease PerM
MTRIIRYTIVVVITLIFLLLLWQFSVAILLFLLSLAVAAALRPLISSITGRNVPKRLALGIVYFLLIAAIVSSLFLISQPLLAEIQLASDDLIANYDRIKAEWPLRGSTFQQTLAEADAGRTTASFRRFLSGHHQLTGGSRLDRCVRDCPELFLDPGPDRDRACPKSLLECGSISV